MSKATIAIIAGASAVTGAAAAALFMSKKQTPVPVPLPASKPSPTSIQSHAPPKHGDLSPVNPAGLFQYGFPGPVNDLATRKALVSCYDRRTKNPMWVAEHITAESLKIKGGDRKNSAFIEDEAIPVAFRGKLADYFRSGYDRGHQVLTWLDLPILLTCPAAGSAPSSSSSCL